MNDGGSLCVAIHQAGTFTERFNERHIRESFGGHTVLVARRGGQERLEAVILQAVRARAGTPA